MNIQHCERESFNACLKEKNSLIRDPDGLTSKPPDPGSAGRRALSGQYPPGTHLLLTATPGFFRTKPEVCLQPNFSRTKLFLDAFPEPNF